MAPWGITYNNNNKIILFKSWILKIHFFFWQKYIWITILNPKFRMNDSLRNHLILWSIYSFPNVTFHSVLKKKVRVGNSPIQ